MGNALPVLGSFSRTFSRILGKFLLGTPWVKKGLESTVSVNYLLPPPGPTLCYKLRTPVLVLFLSHASMRGLEYWPFSRIYATVAIKLQGAVVTK